MQRHWPFLHAYFLRGVRCWLATRALVTVVLWLGGLSALRLSSIASAEMVAMSIGVGIFDTYLRRERDLLANLAIHPLELAGVFAAPALLGELLMTLLVSVRP
jgi:hypothetical protein